MKPVQYGHPWPAVSHFVMVQKYKGNQGCRARTSTTLDLMLQGPLPYTFEDRTGAHTSSDFDDIYDRLFFHVATAPQRSGSSAIMIYSMNRRASRHRDSQPFRHTPSAVLEFLPDGSLGNVSFMQPAGTLTIPMVRYLRKTSLFGRYVVPEISYGNTAPYPAPDSSLSRKFLCSDGREYKWVNRSVEGQEWTVRGLCSIFVAACAYSDARSARRRTTTSLLITT